MISLFKPSIPNLSTNKNFLKKIYKNEIYSNFGPVYNEFKENLSKHFNVPFNNIELFSSGTGALICALNALKKPKKKYCILPSWTFVATAQAVVESKLTPYFVDVSYNDMQMNDKILQQIPKNILKQSSLVLAVSPYGMPINFKNLNKFLKNYKLDLLVDGAAGFDSAFAKNLNIIISMHATKCFGIGEGGMFYSPNRKIVKKARAHSNFGFLNKRESELFGVNYKLNEFNSEIGNISLKKWKSIRSKYFKIAKYYKKNLKSKKISFLQNWGDFWISSTLIIKSKNNLIKNELTKKFDKQNIQWRDWWGAGCHREPSFLNHCKKKSFKNTDKLAKTTIGVPFHIHLKKSEIKKICNIINSI